MGSSVPRDVDEVIAEMREYTAELGGPTTSADFQVLKWADRLDASRAEPREGARHSFSSWVGKRIETGYEPNRVRGLVTDRIPRVKGHLVVALDGGEVREVALDDQLVNVTGNAERDAERLLAEERAKTQRLRDLAFTADAFLNSITSCSWTGADPDELDDLIAEFRAALSTQEGEHR